MRQRYDKYFLGHVLRLQDDWADYLVQERRFDTDDLFGVEHKTFLDHYQAVDLLNACMAHDHTTIHRLRAFLVEQAPRGYLVHHMDDSQVVDEIARIFIEYNYPIVIRPEHEHPFRATNTIDTFSAVNQGGSLAELKKSTALSGTETKLKNAQAGQKTAPTGKNEKAEKKNHQAQLKLLNLGERPPEQARLLPHSGRGWNDPDAFKKVLVNNVNLIAHVSPDTLQHYPVDTVVSGQVIDDFLAWLDGAWPAPEQFQRLLAAFTLGWLYKRVERPTVDVAKEAPAKPVRVISPVKEAPEEPEEEPENHTITIKVVEHLDYAKAQGTTFLKGHADNTPVKGLALKIKLPTGQWVTETTNEEGLVEIRNLPPGTFEFKYETAVRVHNHYYAWFHENQPRDHQPPRVLIESDIDTSFPQKGHEGELALDSPHLFSVYHPPVIIDSHMHIQSGHCSPLDFLWDKLPLTGKNVRVPKRSIIENLDKIIGSCVAKISKAIVLNEASLAYDIEMIRIADEIEEETRRDTAEIFRTKTGTGKAIDVQKMNTFEVANNFVKGQGRPGWPQAANLYTGNKLYKDRHFLMPCMVMPMDMEYAHIDGYFGLKVYNGIYGPKGIEGA